MQDSTRAGGRMLSEPFFPLTASGAGRFVVSRSMTVLLASLTIAFAATAQDATSTKPTIGLRQNLPKVYALKNARIVTEPGQVLEQGMIVIDGRSILAVGAAVSLPAGTEVIDCAGKTIYAGLIDAWGEVEVPSADIELGYWNAHITPERSSRSAAAKLPSTAAKLRSQGVTARLVAPDDGIIKGSSCVALLGDPEEGRRIVRDDAFTHLQLTVPRSGSGTRPRYPNSPMGAVALLRQAFSDAHWYRDAWTAYRSQPGLPRPETNRALQRLGEVMLQGTFIADAPNERMAIRADGIAREFSLKLVLRGSGREYQRLEEIRGTGRPILVPVNFPSTPNVATGERAMEMTLRDLMHWHLAPENPARLVQAGVKICLTSDGLQDPAEFLTQVRRAVQRGLAPEDALAAVTTHPAELLGVSEIVGRVRPGSLANLVVTDGDLFHAKTKVFETWVAGQRFVVQPVTGVGIDEVVGRWRLELEHDNESHIWNLDLKRRGNGLVGSVALPKVNQQPSHATDDQDLSEPNDAEPADAEPADAEPADAEAADAEPNDAEAATDSKQDASTKPPASVPLKNLVRQRDRLTASIDGSRLSEKFAPGTWQMTWVTVPADSRPISVFGSLVDPAGHILPLRVIRVVESDADAGKSVTIEEPAETEAAAPSAAEVATNDSGPSDAAASDAGPSDAAASDAGESDAGVDTEPDAAVPTVAVHYPLGAYGLTESPEQPAAVLFRNATLWTCSEDGILEQGDLLVVAGKIAEVGENVSVPDGCLIIDASGKHITPGLIDCHSHMATDGGVNESGQAVTAEVRVGDFIDNTDIEIYRQLAGGLTIANILHGSANPIGGQNQVIKLRWGGSMDDLRMREAPGGIKFALGENVKRSTSRYPNTRMGVEQILRDQMLAAREYAASWRRWREGERDSLPPRRDLQLEAIAEIQRGQRWIHCHSYRQDEIVATLDVLEEFGIQIGTLQHILEGYKVADRMARHGAMASSFSDWWAYKFEVYDAIPYNGVLMYDAGLVVSYNSDDRELARRMNTEAAKAVKYGGVPPEEALKFVTTNPAKQLRIDHRVGSLEPGKDADLVVWSGRPLSTTTRCEQTWIDGRRYFDVEADKELRRRDAALHARLTQMALSGSNSETATPASQSPPEAYLAEEDRWVRFDVFCNALGSQGSSREEQR